MGRRNVSFFSLNSPKNGKGTIRFPIDKPVPVRLISRIAKFKAQEAAERAAAKRR